MLKGLLTHFAIPTTEDIPQAQCVFSKDCKINRYTAVCLVVFFAFLSGVPSLSALNPADVSIENKSGPYFILDKNNPCQLEPGAAYIAYQICNTKGETLEGVTAELSGLSNGFSLTGGQVAQQSIGDLEPDTCRMVFWYTGYPCDSDLSTDMTISVSDNEVGTVSTTNALGLKVSQVSGSGARADWMDLGTYFTEDGEIYIDIQYQFKNTKKNKELFFQPATNIDFDAGCLQLSRFTILESGVPGVLEGPGEAFYYVLPEKVQGTKEVYARFYFKVNCQSFIANMVPFATATIGNSKLRHRSDGVITEFNVPGDLSLPCAFVQGDEFLQRPFDTGGNNWSTSWADYNRDGYPDLFLTTNDVNQANQLYRNNGDGTFTQIAAGAIATDKAPSTASTWGDYDNDGDPDLFVSNNIGYPNFLYRNDGNGVFTSIQGDPIVEDIGYSHGASWADFDNDGFLDLFVSTYWETEFNLMYRNNGDGSFSMVTNNPVVNEASRSVSGTWADYDGDGWQDLFVANLEGRPNSLYRNLGGGDFEKITTGLIVTEPGWSVGGSWADYDNDGDVDLFVANASEEANFLYQNNGDGTFTKVTSGEIVTDTGHTHGSAWADYDNDGDLDLFVTNDAYDNQLYANNGDGTFTRINNNLTDDGGLSFGTSWADMDSDGDLDLIVANRNGQANFLYENNKWNCNHFACIKLVGTSSNKSAVGAKVTVVAEVNGQMLSQTRSISAQSGGGTGGQNDLTAHFGLGDADLIESITVLWPSGYQQTLADEPVNECITIEEENAAEITGMVFFEEDISCGGNGGAGLPAGAEAAEYRTVQSGDWDSNSTWANGNKPSSNINGKTISIEHDITRDGNLKIQNDGKLWVTNASFTVEGGNFTVSNGEIYLQGAEFEVGDGNFTMSSDQSFIDSKNSVIYVDGNMTNYGTAQMESVCFEVGGNFSSTTGTSEFVNSIVQTGGNFQTALADLHFENTQIRVEDGNFQLTSFTLTTGSNVVVWVEDGNWQNSSSTWSASVTQYCVDGSVSGMSGLPAESCGGISSYFNNNACTAKLTEVNPAAINEENRIPIPNARVVLQPGDITVYTDENGYYSALVPAGGTCEVAVHPGDNWETMCPNEAGILEVAVQEIGARYENNDFGHEALCTLPDMEVEIALTAHRIGFENLMVINYENIGAFTGTDIQLLLSLDEVITPISANIPWQGLAPTILVWNFAQLGPGERGAIYLTYLVDANTAPGLPIAVNAALNCVENDCNAINDNFISTGFAVGAVDPNDILVSPEGGIQAEKELTYKIRFQNVGNTSASHVRIENELPEELDFSTLELGVASHPYQFRAEGNKLIWNFPAINLPDSLSNEPGSHGFVTYRIKPKAELRPGDKFDNGAAIFFDNLAPIITNRVENFILAELVAGAKPNVLYAYPNPTNGMVTAQFQQINLYEEGAHLQTIEVYDQIGRLVLRQHQYRGYHMQLDLGGQTPGLYTLHGIDDQGRRFVGKVIVAE